MKTPVLKLSEGADWVIDRLPNQQYEELKEEMEAQMLALLQKYGYTEDVEAAFNETGPFSLIRRY